MGTVLISGANRGIGLELVRQYAADGWTVYAGCRQPDQADDLRQTAGATGKVEILRLDVSDHAQIDQVAATLRGKPVDILIANAGIYGDESGRGVGNLDYGRWHEVFSVNTMGPVKLAEALLPHLTLGQQRLIVAMTSLMGSMADNGSGGSILYRSSKAALNAAMKSMAIDLRGRGISVVIMHPGWVKTDMGGRNAPTSASESVSGIRQVIAGFKLEDTGKFLNFRGAELPW